MFDVCEHRVLTGHGVPVLCLSFAPDGARLVTGDAFGVFHVWDMLRFTLPNTRHAHDGPVRGVAIAPDGNSLATAGRDGRSSCGRSQT